MRIRVLCSLVMFSLASFLSAQEAPPPPPPMPSDKDIATAKLGEAIKIGNFTLDGFAPRNEQSKTLRGRFSGLVTAWAGVSQERKDAFYKTVPAGVSPNLAIQDILALEDGNDSVMNKIRAKVEAASGLVQKAVQQIIDEKYVDAYMTAVAAVYAWPLVYEDLIVVVPRLDNVQYWMDAMQNVIDGK